MTIKVGFQLQPGDRTEEAMRTILGALFDTILANEDGVLQGLDPEFLHDFRVAVRRTRSALTQVKGVFPEAPAGRFQADFSWLGKVTGPTRDLDVHLLSLPADQADLPAALRRDLDPLIRFLEQQRRREQRELFGALRSQRYLRLLDDWPQFLDTPAAWQDQAPNAKRPVEALAAERIERRYRRVLTRGLALDAESPAAAFHRLRIDGKKLRYLLEFFRSLYDPATVGPLIKTLKILQDYLGSFNDAVVQRAMVEQIAPRVAETSPTPNNALAAMERLVESLAARQAEDRHQSRHAFEELASPTNRALFGRLFPPAPTATSSESSSPG